MSEIFLTPNQFKNRYGTAIPTQWVWRKNGRIPFKKVGNNILYDMTTIDELAFEEKLGGGPLLSIMRIKQREGSK